MSLFSHQITLHKEYSQSINMNYLYPPAQERDASSTYNSMLCLYIWSFVEKTWSLTLAVVVDHNVGKNGLVLSLSSSGNVIIVFNRDIDVYGRGSHAFLEKQLSMR